MMGTLRGGQLTTDPSPSNETLVQGARPLPKRDDDWETEVEEMGAVPATNSKLKDPTATAQTVQQQEHFNSSQLNPQRPAVNITPLGKSPLGTPRSRTASLLTSTLRKFDPNAPNLQIGRDKMSLLARRFEEDGTKDSSQTERSESNALPGQEGKLKHPVGQDCKNGHGQKRKHPTILKDKDHKEEQGIGASEHKKKKKKSKINRSGSPAASSADSEKKPEKPEGGFTFMQGAYYILKREHRFMTAKEIVAIGMKEGFPFNPTNPGLFASSKGKTPEATVAAGVYVDLKKPVSQFCQGCKVGKRGFGLSEWTDLESIPGPAECTKTRTRETVKREDRKKGTGEDRKNKTETQESEGEEEEEMTIIEEEDIGEEEKEEEEAVASIPRPLPFGAPNFTFLPE